MFGNQRRMHAAPTDRNIRIAVLDLLGDFKRIFDLLAGNGRQADQFRFRTDSGIQIILERGRHALINKPHVITFTDGNCGNCQKAFRMPDGHFVPGARVRLY